MFKDYINATLTAFKHKGFLEKSRGLGSLSTCTMKPL